ncbi:hypothetical protein P171DRAFT_215336 [Karstenula rhodostoma CBS 690.94]|uniref:Uncharacterized protein n=1 Tax=Karstenula rhodostoma CBS 690.94 TaxID=1392251 RepID=A0A9P4UFI9_9PLEO|nr:hypothetical protein P171DRAFT_215336 [Karstenula rhodostoma CBS 690.94]
MSPRSNQSHKGSDSLSHVASQRQGPESAKAHSTRKRGYVVQRNMRTRWHPYPNQARIIHRRLRGGKLQSDFISLVLGSHINLQPEQISRLLSQSMHTWVEHGPEESEVKISECIRKAAERKHADDIDAMVQLAEKLKKIDVEEPDDGLSKAKPFEDDEMGDILPKTRQIRDVEMGGVPESSEASMDTSI